MEKDGPPWAHVVGALVVFALVASVGLTAAGGWKWFAEFLTTGAPGWLQAIGALVAIVVAYHMGNAQMVAARALEVERRREADRRALRVLMLMSSGAVGTLTLFLSRWEDEPIVPPVGMLRSLGALRTFIGRIDPLTLSHPTVAVEVTQLPLELEKLDAAVADAESFVNAKHFERTRENLQQAVRNVLSSVQFLFDECQGALKQIGY